MFNKEDIVWKIENKLIFYYDLIKIGFKFQPKRIVEQHWSLALESPSIEAALLITLPARKHILTGLWAEQTVSPQKLTWGPFPCSFHLSKEGVSNHIILNQSALDSDTIVHIDGQMGIWSQPKETKEWKGQCLSYLQWMNKISHNLFSSHHTTNPVCALSTATDSHLVIFRARHIQPEGTNYSSLFNMLQCLQRAVLEKYTLLGRKSLRKQRRGLSVINVKFIPKATKEISLGSWTCSGGKLSGLKLTFKVALWIELFFCTVSKYCCLNGVWNQQGSASCMWILLLRSWAENREGTICSCECTGEWDLKCYWNKNTNHRCGSLWIRQSGLLSDTLLQLCQRPVQ